MLPKEEQESDEKLGTVGKALQRIAKREGIRRPSLYRDLGPELRELLGIQSGRPQEVENQVERALDDLIKKVFQEEPEAEIARAYFNMHPGVPRETHLMSRQDHLKRLRIEAHSDRHKRKGYFAIYGTLEDALLKRRDAQQPNGGESRSEEVESADSSAAGPTRADADAIKRLNLADLTTRNPAGHYEPNIVVISGMGGVGKTYLADQLAADLLASENFTKFAFVDFLGFSATDSPGRELQPSEALGKALAELGVQDIPPDEGNRLSRYRRLATEHDLLLVFDNVLTESQVEALLPRDNRGLVLITSRAPLARFARNLQVGSARLEPLRPDQSAELLRTYAVPDLEDHPGALATVVEHCAGLPLALDIMARLMKDREIPVDSLRDRLEESPLDTMYHPSGSIDPRSIFWASYEKLKPDSRNLHPDAQPVFRRLGLRFNQDIDEYAIALLAGESSVAKALPYIRRLEHVGLIRRGGERLQVHDLVHAFARDLIAGDNQERRDTLDRLVSAYYVCVNHAFTAVNSTNPVVDIESLAITNDVHLAGIQSIKDYCERTGGNPAQWVAVEKENLVRLAIDACQEDPPIARAPHLAFSLFYFLETSNNWSDWKRLNDIGLKAAMSLGDLWAQARLRRNMGRIELVTVRDQLDALHDHLEVDDIVAARERCARAVTLLQESGGLYEQCPERAHEAVTVKRELADTHLMLAKLAGSPDERTGHLARAVEAYAVARAAYMQFENSDNPIASLNVSLAEAVIRGGDSDSLRDIEGALHESIAYAKQYDAERRSYRHPRVWCFAFVRLAELHIARAASVGSPRLAREELAQADASYEEAVALFQRFGNWLDRARTLARRGLLHRDMGDVAGARDLLEVAREILSEYEHSEEGVVQAWLERLGMP